MGWRAAGSRTPPGSTRRKIARASLSALLYAVLAACSLAVVHASTPRAPGIDWDEFGWLAVSDATFRMIFVDRDGDAARWHEGLQVTSYGAMNPNFSKLVMGAALYGWGYDLAPPPFFPLMNPAHERYDRLTAEQRRDLAREHLPYVRKLRRLVLGTSAACAVALFLLGRALGGAVLGAAAYAAFVLTPLVGPLAFVVYTDMLLLLMMLLSTLATVRLLRWWGEPASRVPPGRAILALLGLGALFAATVGTKYNGALVCIACGASALVLWLAGRFAHRRPWHTAAALMATGGIAFGIFVAMNPQLHDDVLGRIAWSVREWNALIASQQAEAGDAAALTTVGERLAAVWRRALLQTGPLARVFPPGAPLLAGLGLAVLVLRFVRACRGRGDLVGPTVLLVWVLVLGAGTTLWLPLDRPRYCLPLVPGLCLLQAVAIDAAWLGAKRGRRAIARRHDPIAASQR